MVAAASGAKYAVATSAGTTRCTLLLWRLAEAMRDLVIAPSFTHRICLLPSHCGAQALAL